MTAGKPVGELSRPGPGDADLTAAPLYQKRPGGKLEGRETARVKIRRCPAALRVEITGSSR